MTIKNNTIKIFWIFSIPTIYALITIISASQPFIPSNNYLNLLKFLVFPILLISYHYLIFIKKDKELMQTRFQINFQKKTKNHNKIRKIITKIFYVFFIHVSASLMFAVLLFVTQWYPAWPVKYLAEQPVIIQAAVIELGNIRRTSQSKIYLKDRITGNKFNIHWSSSAIRVLKVGDRLELTTRKHWFGLYVDKVTILQNIP
jgi:hypothetical protein